MVTAKIHYKFLEIHRLLCKQYDISNAPIYKTPFTVKWTKSIEEEGIEIIEPQRKELLTINGKVSLSYESLMFLFSLNGHDKNLLLFLIAYCVDENAIFLWNRVVSEHYADFYQATTEKRPKYNTIRQSIVVMEKKNIIRKLEKGKFMVNPLLISTSQFNRTNLIKRFGEISKNKNVIEALFQ